MSGGKDETGRNTCRDKYGDVYGGVSGLPVLSEEDFISLPLEKVLDIVEKAGRPRTVCFTPDGTRRAAIVWYGLDPGSPDFDRKKYSFEHPIFMENLMLIYDHGAENLLVPILNHKNLERPREFIEGTVYPGVRELLVGDEWDEFYREYDVRVRCYGDRQHLLDKGFEKLVEWMEDVENRTAGHKKRRLFWGICCSNSIEHTRLAHLGARFFSRKSRLPTRDELIEMYYGEVVPDVEIFIRPSEVRDSDLTPPIVTGSRAQFYFPVVSSMVKFDARLYRRILYDYLYNRPGVMGKRYYSGDSFTPEEKEFLRRFYAMNMYEVLGVGMRIGPHWIPTTRIHLPENNGADENAAGQTNKKADEQKINGGETG